MGNDREWSQKLFHPSNYNIHVSFATATVDLAFANEHCDSILLTASASTFAFWIAYLSNSDSTSIYYNRQFSKPFGIERELVVEDFFLPEWISLSFENGHIRTVK